MERVSPTKPPACFEVTGDLHDRIEAYVDLARKDALMPQSPSLEDDELQRLSKAVAQQLKDYPSMDSSSFIPDLPEPHVYAGNTWAVVTRYNRVTQTLHTTVLKRTTGLTPGKQVWPRENMPVTVGQVRPVTLLEGSSQDAYDLMQHLVRSGKVRSIPGPFNLTRVLSQAAVETGRILTCVKLHAGLSWDAGPRAPPSARLGIEGAYPSWLLTAEFKVSDAPPSKTSANARASASVSFQRRLEERRKKRTAEDSTFWGEAAPAVVGQFIDHELPVLLNNELSSIDMAGFLKRVKRWSFSRPDGKFKRTSVGLSVPTTYTPPTTTDDRGASGQGQRSGASVAGSGDVVSYVVTSENRSLTLRMRYYQRAVHDRLEKEQQSGSTEREHAAFA